MIYSRVIAGNSSEILRQIFWQRYKIQLQRRKWNYDHIYICLGKGDKRNESYQSAKVCVASWSSKGQKSENPQLTCMNLQDSKRCRNHSGKFSLPLPPPSLDHPFVTQLPRELSTASELLRVFHSYAVFFPPVWGLSSVAKYHLLLYVMSSLQTGWIILM